MNTLVPHVILRASLQDQVNMHPIYSLFTRVSQSSFPVLSLQVLQSSESTSKNHFDFVLYTVFGFAGLWRRSLGTSCHVIRHRHVHRRTLRLPTGHPRPLFPRAQRRVIIDGPIIWGFELEHVLRSNKNLAPSMNVFCLNQSIDM
jgi:hypothetical protein